MSRQGRPNAGDNLLYFRSMKGEKIKFFEVSVFRVPLKTPFITSLGKKSESVNVGLTLRLADGAEGYGEASSSLALARLSPRRLSGVLRTLAERAIGRDAAGAVDLIRSAWDTQGEASPAAAAFECALLEALMASRHLTLAAWFGGKLKRIESDITLSAADANSTAAAAFSAKQAGFRILKIKVTGDFSRNMSRIKAAHGAHPRARLILDGNQGMTSKGALRLVETCLGKKLEVILLEQPLPKSDYLKMRELARVCPIPLAADESVATPAQALRVAAEECARVINIKVAKSGLLRSLEIAAIARGAGLDLMIGCMAETARGLGPSVHLALGTGFFRYVDLDSDVLQVDGAWGGGKADWTRRGPWLSLD